MPEGWRDGAPEAAITLHADVEVWPLKERFVIARGAKSEARVVVVTASRGGVAGRGECVPYARYGETVESVLGAIRGAGAVSTRDALREALPTGAARSAIDCALWDLEAKETGRSVADRLGLAPLSSLDLSLIHI